VPRANPEDLRGSFLRCRPTPSSVPCFPLCATRRCVSYAYDPCGRPHPEDRRRQRCFSWLLPLDTHSYLPLIFRRIYEQCLTFRTSACSPEPFGSPPLPLRGAKQGCLCHEHYSRICRCGTARPPALRHDNRARRRRRRCDVGTVVAAPVAQAATTRRKDVHHLFGERLPGSRLQARPAHPHRQRPAERGFLGQGHPAGVPAR
jgi:hypothetical protein